MLRNFRTLQLSRIDFFHIRARSAIDFFTFHSVVFPFFASLPLFALHYLWVMIFRFFHISHFNSAFFHTFYSQIRRFFHIFMTMN